MTNLKSLRTSIDPAALEDAILDAVATYRRNDIKSSRPSGSIRLMLPIDPPSELKDPGEYYAWLAQAFFDLITDAVSLETHSPWPTANYDVELLATVSRSELLFSYVDRGTGAVEVEFPPIALSAFTRT